MVKWHLWQGKTGETPRKTYPDSLSFTTSREFGTPSVGRARLTACTTEPSNIFTSIHEIKYKFTGKPENV